MTPMMLQYHEAKAAHPGMMVLFRNGDFYELFEDDAELGHKLLGLTLTKRDKDIPMAGFPVHKLEHYLGLLLRQGRRVAVCEQMENAHEGKKIIRREVNRIVTPGTVTEDELLDPRRPNHLAALARGKNGTVGLAWADLSSGTFAAHDFPELSICEELARLNVVECLRPEHEAATWGAGMLAGGTMISRPSWTFDPTSAREALSAHFGVATMAGFGFDDGRPCLTAAGGLLLYLRETMKADLGHLRRLAQHRPEDFLILDETTRRSLELTRTLRDNLREGSLLSTIDRTITPMGARFLHDALSAPLNRRAPIEARLDAVQEFLHDHPLRGSIRELLEATSDLQRLTTRVSTARATPKDLAAIARTLRLLPRFKAKLAGRKSGLIQDLESRLELCIDLREKLDRALVDDPPYSAKEGGILREGFHAELDELRKLARDGKDWIARYQADEVTRSGIASLKVGFTDVMGYYIEITNANETRVPADYIHERTLKNAKRYSTPRLKEYEEKVVTAQERSQALEFELFLQLRDTIAAQTHRLLQTAEALALLDFVAALAELAALRNYERPEISDEPMLAIEAGRHPVLDQTLAAGLFVPNDVEFGPKAGMVRLITGPNMSGKSTFIRQTALLTLLAHLGSFLPAKSAVIGLTDRIFTRVGASDELGRGQSTFMVEMTEAANILNNATPRSLVILDEIGRGTSTYDGLSLAWAITEHLHDAVGCRTLFATHYHELTQLERTLQRLRNYTVQVEEVASDVVFLHRIAPGCAGKSYGIHVAKLAGIPKSVLTRATEVLHGLEGTPVPAAAVHVVTVVEQNSETQAPPATERRRPKAAAVPVVIEPPESQPRKIKVESAVPNLFNDADA